MELYCLAAVITLHNAGTGSINHYSIASNFYNIRNCWLPCASTRSLIKQVIMRKAFIFDLLLGAHQFLFALGYFATDFLKVHFGFLYFGKHFLFLFLYMMVDIFT
jgi:hypothetical protein